MKQIKDIKITYNILPVGSSWPPDLFLIDFTQCAYAAISIEIDTISCFFISWSGEWGSGISPLYTIYW